MPGAAMNLGVGRRLAFGGQPDLLRMIEIAQKARQPELVRALHEQYRMLLGAPAGVAPGDKDRFDTLNGASLQVSVL